MIIGNEGPVLAQSFLFGQQTVSLCVLVRLLLKSSQPFPRSVLLLGEDCFYTDGVVVSSAISGTDEAMSRGRWSVLWAGDCCGRGCSCVGPWIFLSMVICRLFIITLWHQQSENTSSVQIPVLILILSSGLGTSCRLCFWFFWLPLLFPLLVKAEIHIWKAYCTEDKMLSLCS